MFGTLQNMSYSWGHRRSTMWELDSGYVIGTPLLRFPALRFPPEGETSRLTSPHIGRSIAHHGIDGLAIFTQLDTIRWVQKFYQAGGVFPWFSSFFNGSLIPTARNAKSIGVFLPRLGRFPQFIGIQSLPMRLAI